MKRKNRGERGGRGGGEGTRRESKKKIRWGEKGVWVGAGGEERNSTFHYLGNSWEHSGVFYYSQLKLGYKK